MVGGHAELARVNHLALLLPLALASAACDPPLRKVDTPIARGEGFEVAVPSGYKLIDDPRVPLGAGVVAMSAERQDDWFVASIVINPAFGAPPPTDDATCRQAAGGLEATLGTKIDRIGMVQLARGSACQFDMHGNDDARRVARGTVMSAAGRTYSVTCNHDQRDARAVGACGEVLRDWREVP